MTIKQITELMHENITAIASCLKVPTYTVISWINDPKLILDLGVIEVNRISYCIDIELKVFLETFENEFPPETWA